MRRSGITSPITPRSRWRASEAQLCPLVAVGESMTCFAGIKQPGGAGQIPGEPPPQWRARPSWRACAGRSSSTTASSTESWGSTTTRVAATPAGITTAPLSPARTPLSPWSACAHQHGGRPESPRGRPPAPTAAALLERHMPDLPPARRSRPARALPSAGVTKHY